MTNLNDRRYLVEELESPDPYEHYHDYDDNQSEIDHGGDLDMSQEPEEYGPFIPSTPRIQAGTLDDELPF